MRKSTTEDGGIACGVCAMSLQEATFIFGIADVVHGIVGLGVLTTMIVKQEGDAYDRKMYTPINKQEKVTGYNEWLSEFPTWILQWIFIAFMVQVALGILLSLGSTYRNSSVCSTWLIISFLITLTTPSTYCLIGLGRLFEYAAVLEFVWKMDDEKTRYSAVERTLDFRRERGKL